MKVRIKNVIGSTGNEWLLWELKKEAGVKEGDIVRVINGKILKDEKKRMNPQILYLLCKTRYNGVCLQGA